MSAIQSDGKMPEVVVFAGPNGSGKSTITDVLRPIGIKYINADEIKAAISCTDIEAAKLAEKLRESCLAEHSPFCFETVLSTDRNLNLLVRAKEAGFFIRGFFVLTCDPHINLARVITRVAAGGHGVPEEKIMARYFRSINLLPSFIQVCDVCSVYDNSGYAPYRIFKKRKDSLYYDDQGEYWSQEEILALTKAGTPGFKQLN